jgi:hypothetical protein
LHPTVLFKTSSPTEQEDEDEQFSLVILFKSKVITFGIEPESQLPLHDNSLPSPQKGISSKIDNPIPEPLEGVEKSKHLPES